MLYEIWKVSLHSVLEPHSSIHMNVVRETITRHDGMLIKFMRVSKLKQCTLEKGYYIPFEHTE